MPPWDGEGDPQLWAFLPSRAVAREREEGDQMEGCQVEEADFICATRMGIAALCSPGLRLLGAQVAVSRVGSGRG